MPIDHGLTLGPIEGLASTGQIAEWIRSPGINGILAHKGMVERLADRGLLADRGVMIHLNGMSAQATEPDKKERVTSVESAVRLGADGVSVQVNFDGTNDAHNIRLLGEVVDEAQEYGLPVLAMVYDKVKHASDGARVARLQHLMRIAIELGSDALKIAAPPSLAEVKALLAETAEDVHVFFAGGAKCEAAELVELLREALAWGGAGLCVGRNVFQRSSAEGFLKRLSDVIAAEGKGQGLAGRDMPVGARRGESGVSTQGWEYVRR